MAVKKLLILGVLVGLFALPVMQRMVPVQAGSAAAQENDAPKAPPAEPVYEVDAGDRAGYKRVSGYWKWTGANFMWMPGRWIAEKPNYIWVADSWTQRGKKWHFTPGHWDMDEDNPPPAEVAPELQSNEPVADEAEEATPEPVATNGKKAAKKPHKVKRPVTPNYNDSTYWPRVVHH